MNETNNSADHLASAGGVEVVAMRTRYRSEPGMIGHYPWSYSDYRRGGIRGGRIPQYEYEPLVTQSDHLAAFSKEREVADGLRDLLLRQSIIVGELSKGLTEDDDLAQEIVSLNSDIDKLMGGLDV